MYQINYDIALCNFNVDIHILNNANFYLFLVSIE